MNDNAINLKTELDNISKKLVSLDKYLQKIEDEGVYDSEIYDKIEKLEKRRNELEELLEQEEA